MPFSAESIFQGATHFHSQIYVISSRASKSAIEAIEKWGGKIVCQYYNPLALRDCVEGRRDRISAAPTRREDIGTFLPVLIAICVVLNSAGTVWYGQHANRGYLSPITLRKLANMPFIEERWKELSVELNKWRTQHFDKQKKV
jgi:large subunit ribosomal protein L15